MRLVNYKITTFLLLGITIILCFGNIMQRQEISKLNVQSSKIMGRIDTVFVKKPFKFEKAFNTVQLPRYVFLYWPNSLQAFDISCPGHRKDFQNQDNAVSIEDSLVQVILDRGDLFLSFKNTLDSSYLKLDYKIDLDKFKYNWVNGNLTSEPISSKLKLSPYIYLSYRPINYMADLGIGFNIKTQRFQYKLGLKGFYYPCLRDKLGADLELSITHNFD